MIGRALRSCVGPVAVLMVSVALWWLASEQQWISRVFLPSPQATALSLVEGWQHGALADQALATTGRMLQGWLLACLAGAALGAAIGTSPRARAWLQPGLEFVRPLPASALMPLAIAVFGLSDAMVLAVVAFGAMWPVLLSTLHGFGQVEPRLREVAQALQLSPRVFIVKIGLPSALPDMLAGMRLSMTVSLVVAVVGEMLASQTGLGQAILMAARSFRASELFAGIALLGVIGLCSNSLVSLLERGLLRWQRP